MSTQEPTWFKSSHSSGDSGDCVDVAVSPHLVRVRDSKDTGGPHLAFSPAAWAEFTAFDGALGRATAG